MPKANHFLWRAKRSQSARIMCCYAGVLVLQVPSFICIYICTWDCSYTREENVSLFLFFFFFLCLYHIASFCTTKPQRSPVLMVMPAVFPQLSKWMAELSKHVHFLQADSSRCGAGDIQWNEPNESANYSFFSQDDMFIRPWNCVFLSRLTQSTLTRMKRGWEERVWCKGVGAFARFRVTLYLGTSF